jgi:hypothetical protein
MNDGKKHITLLNWLGTDSKTKGNKKHAKYWYEYQSPNQIQAQINETSTGSMVTT